MQNVAGSTTRRQVARCGRAGAVVGLAASVFVTGCAKSRAPAESLVRVPELAPPPATDGASLDWVLISGEACVVPVDPALLAGLREENVRLEDGSLLTLHPYVLRVKQGGPGGGGSDPTSVVARAGWWLSLSEGGRGRTWLSEAVKAAGSSPVGSDGATVVLVEAKGGNGGTAETGGEVAGRRVNVRWLRPLKADAALAGVFSRPVSDEAWESVWMRASLAIARSSPLTRWRARLASGEFQSLIVSAEQSAGRPGFDDPVIEALAGTIESQWLSALTNLALQDPLLARRVVERLCATADTGGGAFVPAWVPEGEQLTGLLDSLMDPRPGKSVESARGWLENTDAVLCWIVDDAGSADPGSGEPVGTAGVANLTGAPLAAWVETSTPAAVPEMLAVSPWSMRRIPVSPGDFGPERTKGPAGIAADAALRGERVPMRAGDRSFVPTIYSRAVPALAPGVVIGPLHPDWRLADWLAASTSEGYSSRLGPWSKSTLADPDWTTTGMVYRGVDAPLERGGSAPDRWLLYVELKDGAGSSREGGTDTLRVYFGWYGRSSIVLKVLPDGRVIDESPPGQETGASRDVPRLARVARTGAGWTCWLPIPLGAIENDGLLRLGVERVDGRGVRTSWPRPSLPWQQEPSRIAIDTSIWGAGTPGELGGAGGTGR